MFGTTRQGAAAYAKVDLETSTIAANPHKLIVMLFDGALVALRSAIVHMEARDIEKKGAAISKAISIVQNGLRASLDKNAGGEIAMNLDALYDYQCRRMLEANLKNDRAMLGEVIVLLEDLKSAWESIGAPRPAAANAGQMRPMAYDTPSHMATFAIAG